MKIKRKIKRILAGIICCIGWMAVLMASGEMAGGVGYGLELAVRSGLVCVFALCMCVLTLLVGEER